MDNPVFEEDISMVPEEGYDDYRTPDTSRVDETSFIEPNITEATSTLQQKLNRDRIIALYRHLNVTGNLDLIDLDRLRRTKGSKNGVTIFKFYNGERWVL